MTKSDSTTTRQPVNILVVDDREANLAVMRALLDQPDYHLVTALSGKEALRHLLKGMAFALVIMDVQMPVMDGFETAALIKARKSTRDIPIIFVSALHIEEKDIFKGYAVGAYDYLTKPVNHQILQSKVAVFVRLFRLTRETIHLEKEKARAEELASALQSQKILSNWHAPPPSIPVDEPSSMAPLHERDAPFFTECRKAYERILVEYVENIQFKKAPPREKIQRLAGRIGQMAGGPKDIIDLHLQSVKAISEGAEPGQIKSYTLDGRLVALEIMGQLAEFYRRFFKPTQAMMKEKGK